MSSFIRTFFPLLSEMIYLSFDESKLVELKFGRRKKYILPVLYQIPAFNHTSPVFRAFLSNFTNLHQTSKQNNTLLTLVTGDFNVDSQLWWPDG